MSSTNTQSKKLAIGIDLGTTYSAVGVYRNGAVEIITNANGNRITPSWVAFSGNERLVGDAAKNQVASNPCNTVFDAKRLIGRLYNDPTVQADMAHWPFKVLNVDGKPQFEVAYMGELKHFTPEIRVQARSFIEKQLIKVLDIVKDSKPSSNDKTFAHRPMYLQIHITLCNLPRLYQDLKPAY